MAQEKDWTQEYSFVDSYSESMKQDLRGATPEPTGGMEPTLQQASFQAGNDALLEELGATHEREMQSLIEARENFALSNPTKFVATQNLVAETGISIDDEPTGNYNLLALDPSFFPVDWVQAPTYDPERFKGFSLDTAYALAISHIQADPNVRKTVAAYFRNKADYQFVGNPYDPSEDDAKAMLVDGYFTLYKDILDKGISPLLLGSPLIKSLSYEELQQVWQLVNDDAFKQVINDFEDSTDYEQQRILNELYQESMSSQEAFEKNRPYVQMMSLIQQRDNEDNNFFESIYTGMSQYASNALGNWTVEDTNKLIEAAVIGGTTFAALGAVTSAGLASLPLGMNGAFWGSVVALGYRQSQKALLVNQYSRIEEMWASTNLYNLYGSEVSEHIVRPYQWAEILSLAKRNETFELLSTFSLDMLFTLLGGKLVGFISKGAGKAANVGKLAFSKASSPTAKANSLFTQQVLGKAENASIKFEAYGSEASALKTNLSSITRKADDPVLSGEPAARRSFISENVSDQTKQALGTTVKELRQEGAKVVDNIRAAGRQAQINNVKDFVIGGAVDTFTATTLSGIESGFTEAGNKYVRDHMAGLSEEELAENYRRNFLQGLQKGVSSSVAMNAMVSYFFKGIGNLVQAKRLHSTFSKNINLQQALFNDFFSTLNNNPAFKAKIIDELVASGKTSLPDHIVFRGYDLEQAVKDMPDLKDSSLYRLYEAQKTLNGGASGDLTLTAGELITRLDGDQLDIELLRKTGLVDDAEMSFEDLLYQYKKLEVDISNYLAKDLNIGKKVDIDPQAEAKRDAQHADYRFVADAVYNRISQDEINQLTAAKERGASLKEQREIVNEAQTKAPNQQIGEPRSAAGVFDAETSKPFVGATKDEATPSMESGEPSLDALPSGDDAFPFGGAEGTFAVDQPPIPSGAGTGSQFAVPSAPFAVPSSPFAAPNSPSFGGAVPEFPSNGGGAAPDGSSLEDYFAKMGGGDGAGDGGLGSDSVNKAGDDSTEIVPLKDKDDVGGGDSPEPNPEQDGAPNNESTQVVDETSGEQAPTEMELAADKETAARSMVYKNTVRGTRNGLNVSPKLVQQISDYTYTLLNQVAEITGKSIQELLSNDDILPKIKVVKEIKSGDDIKINGTYDAETNTITFVQGAEFHTFIHEFGHYTLETLMRTSDNMVSDVEARVLQLRSERAAAEKALAAQEQLSLDLATQAANVDSPLEQKQLTQDANIALGEAKEASDVLQTTEAEEGVKAVAANVENIKEQYKDPALNQQIEERGQAPYKNKEEILKRRADLIKRHQEEQTRDLEALNKAIAEKAEVDASLVNVEIKISEISGKVQTLDATIKDLDNQIQTAEKPGKLLSKKALLTTRLNDYQAQLDELQSKYKDISPEQKEQLDCLRKEKEAFFKKEEARKQERLALEQELREVALEDVRNPLIAREEKTVSRLETQPADNTYVPLSYDAMRNKAAKSIEDYQAEALTNKSAISNNQDALAKNAKEIQAKEEQLARTKDSIKNAQEALKAAKSFGEKVSVAERKLERLNKVKESLEKRLSDLAQEEKNLKENHQRLLGEKEAIEFKLQRAQVHSQNLDAMPESERLRLDQEAQSFQDEVKQVAANEKLSDATKEFITAIAQFKMWANIDPSMKWSDLTAQQRAEIHEKFVLAYLTQHLSGFSSKAPALTSAYDRALLQSYQRMFMPQMFVETTVNEAGETVTKKRRPKAEENAASVPVIQEKMNQNFRDSYNLEPNDAFDRDFTLARYMDEIAHNYFANSSPYAVYTKGDLKDFGEFSRFLPFLSKDAQDLLKQAQIESAGEIEAAYAKHSLTMAVIVNRGKSLDKLIDVINGSNLSDEEKQAQITALKQWGDNYTSIRKRIGKEWAIFKSGDRSQILSDEVKQIFENYRVVKDLVKQMQAGGRGYGAQIVRPISYQDFIEWGTKGVDPNSSSTIKVLADRLYKLGVLTKRNGVSVNEFLANEGMRFNLKNDKDLTAFFAKFDHYESSEAAFLERLAREEFCRNIRNLDSTAMGAAIDLSRIDKEIIAHVERYGSIIMDDLFSFTNSLYKTETSIVDGKVVTKKVKILDWRTSLKDEAYNELKFVRLTDLNPNRYASESKRLLVLAAREASRGANADMTKAGNYMHAAMLKGEMAVQASAMQMAITQRLKNFKHTFSLSDEELAKRYDVNTMREGQALLAYMGVLNKDKYFGREDQLAVVNPSQLEKIQDFIGDQDKLLYFREMTVRDLDDTLNQLASIKKEAIEVFAARKEAEKLGMDMGDVTKLIDQRLELKNKGKETESISGLQNELNDRRPFYKRVLETNAAALVKMELFCEAVQGSTNGKVKDVMYTPVRDAQTAFNKANAELSIKLDNIMKEADREFSKPLPDKSKTYTLQTADGTPLSVRGYNKKGNEIQTSMVLGSSAKYKGRPRTEIFGIMLHMGNDSNKERAAASLGVSVEELESAIRKAEDDGVITEAMWDKAQEVWDLYEDQLHGSLDTFYKLNGYYFDVVFANDFVSASGKAYKGGYIPVVYIEELGKVTAEVEALSKGAQEMLPQSTTKSQFTKSRSKKVLGKQIDFDPANLALGLRKQLRYQHFAEPVTRLYRLITQDTELSRKLELIMPGFSKIYKEWLLDVADQNTTSRSLSPEFRRANSVLSNILSNANASALTGNLGNILSGFSNLFTVIPRLGLSGLISGLFGTMSTRDIAKVSPFMAERLQFRRNSVQNACARLDHSLWNKIDFPLQKLNDFSYFIQSKLQAYIDRMVWTAAYNKALKGSVKELSGKNVKMTDAEAVKFADATVRDTQGSFDVVDTAALERTTALTKIFIPFSSYFISVGNLIRSDLIKAGFNESRINRYINYSKVLAFSFYLPTVIGELLNQAGKGAFFDDEKDPEEIFINSLIYSPIRSSALAASPFLSPVGNTIDYATGQSYGTNALYQNMAMNIGFGSVKSTIDILKGEEDEKDYINLMRLMSLRWGVTGVVSNNANTVMEAVKNN